MPAALRKLENVTGNFGCLLNVFPETIQDILIHCDARVLGAQSAYFASLTITISAALGMLESVIPRPHRS